MSYTSYSIRRMGRLGIPSEGTMPSDPVRGYDPAILPDAPYQKPWYTGPFFGIPTWVFGVAIGIPWLVYVFGRRR